MPGAVLVSLVPALAAVAEPPGPQFPFEKQDHVVLGNGAPGTFDSTHAKYPCVLRVGDEWWMWYNGRADDAFIGGVGLATSRDGLEWTKQNGVGPQKSFRVGHATSRDGTNWQRENSGDLVLEPGAVGERREQYVYNVMVLLRGGTYHMWYSSMLHANDDDLRKRHVPNSICLVHASSPDGTHWTKDNALTLSNGPPGSLDAYACFACYVVPREDGL